MVNFPSKSPKVILVSCDHQKSYDKADVDPKEIGFDNLNEATVKEAREQLKAKEINNVTDTIRQALMPSFAGF